MKDQSYIEGYVRWRAAEGAKAEEERQRLIAKLQGLWEYFDGKPGLRRVYVFGSAASPGRFGPGSDVDLATEGLPPEHLCQTLSELVDRLERSVDAVRLEDTTGPLRERIEKGTVAYERGASPDS